MRAIFMNNKADFFLISANSAKFLKGDDNCKICI